MSAGGVGVRDERDLDRDSRDRHSGGRPGGGRDRLPAPGRWRGLPGDGRVRQRGPAGGGQPGEGRRSGGGERRGDRRVPGRHRGGRVQHRRRGLHAAQRGTRASSSRPRCPASPTATSTSSWGRRRRGDRGRRADRARRDRDRGGARPDVQPLRPKTPCRGCRTSCRARRTRSRGRGDELRRGIHYLNPTLSTGSRLFEELTRDERTARAVPRRLGPSGQHARRAPRRAHRRRAQPQHHLRRAGEPAGCAGGVGGAAAAVPAPGEHDLREPAGAL